MVENKKAKLLTLTTRTTLSDVHATSFSSLNMHHYQHTENLDVRALTVCLNSLLKLSHLKPEDMKHYVLYLDEVASFLEFTHNDTLDNN